MLKILSTCKILSKNLTARWLGHLVPCHSVECALSVSATAVEIPCTCEVTYEPDLIVVRYGARFNFWWKFRRAYHLIILPHSKAPASSDAFKNSFAILHPILE